MEGSFPEFFFPRARTSREADLFAAALIADGAQYRQLFRSAPGGALFSIRSAIFGANIWW